MQQVVLEERLFEGAVSFERGTGWIRPWRLPSGELRLFADALVERASTPAGVRLRFRTDSKAVALAVERHAEQRLFDLSLDGDLIATVPLEAGEEEVRFERLPGGTKTVELWLPQRMPVLLRHMRVDDGAGIEAAPDDRPRWLTYGSSITHCGGAHSPARTWPAIVARRHGLNLTCLGYGGNCHVEPMVARMIRDLPADFISLKLGINVHGGSLSPRTFEWAAIGLVQTIREKHPDIPVAVISPIISPPRETTPGATGLTLAMMRQQLADAVRRMADCGDANLYYFDGRELFGENLVEDYLPDLLHPNGDGYEKLAEGFCRVVMPGIPL